MGHDSQDAQRKEQIIAAIDAQTLSPAARAQVVWAALKEKLPDATNWDLICFCTEYLGYCVSEFEWLEPPAKRLSTLVYTAHYLNAHAITESETRIKRDAEHSNSRSDTTGEQNTERDGPNGESKLPKQQPESD